MNTPIAAAVLAGALVLSACGAPPPPADPYAERKAEREYMQELYQEGYDAGHRDGSESEHQGVWVITPPLPPDDGIIVVNPWADDE